MLLKNLLAALEEIERDLSYTQELSAKWEREAERFPVIYEYIIKQIEFFKQEIEKLFSIDINNNAISEFVRQRAQTAQSSGPEYAASEAQVETAEREPDEIERSADNQSQTVTQEPRICEPQFSHETISISHPSPPVEEEEEISTQKQSERKSASRSKSRKRAGKKSGE